MKTTIEIADDLFRRTQKVAQKEKTTFRALTEQGLRLVLERKERRGENLPPLVTVRGTGVNARYASWEELREAVYEGRGA